MHCNGLQLATTLNAPVKPFLISVKYMSMTSNSKRNHLLKTRFLSLSKYVVILYKCLFGYVSIFFRPYY